MHLYVFDYMPSNGGMTWPIQGQGHRTWVTKMEKMAYFDKITGSRSLSVQHYSCGQILVGIFQKLTSSTL